jgi:DNA polymerase-3 subunit epsilon
MHISKLNLKTINKNSIRELPQAWGVYFFLDEHNFPLYIGMSNNLKHRMLSHFREQTIKKYRLIDQTKKIGYIQTSGKLTTWLLESNLIKQFKPQFNRMLRKNRYVAVLELGYDKNGYKSVIATREKNIETNETIAGTGIFRSKRHAEGVLSKLQSEYQLCPKLLGFESGSGACFSYHLKKCSGACAGIIKPDEYNQLFDLGISEFIVPQWEKDLKILENKDKLQDEFIIQSWTIKAHNSNYLPLSLSNPTSFEFDDYKIIKSFIQKVC